MAISISPNSEPIPGYRLKDRLGSGGYGEVWECEAPGELTKAIKFVYGRMDDDRAARELKSLNRIKTARHPFLLSLERIEVIDGQLVIVTELADQCLKDRFEECKASGLCGIPREELLVYMSDTADALDYMSEKHSLQHLDVKPENLLLLGGRVKVADFGLVKELHGVTASMMGGLTPLYAPPEVFDGRPTRFSDQYSLAIVYQEMLTGVLPFAGTTAAQLAAQHLSGKPRTSALQPSDQAAIERALSKDPRRRFNNCKELVSALANPASSQPHAGVDLAERAPRSGESVTAKLTATPAPASFARQPAVSDSCLPQVLSAAPLKLMGPLPLEAPRTYRPLVLVGVGGLSTQVLQRFHQRIHDQFGSAEAVPAIEMLVIDTDQKSLLMASRGVGADVLPQRQLLAAPLRKPQDYRDDSSLILKSMSRRWLYNIPRSQQTEGLRPLGRLALLDAAGSIRAKLVEALQAVMDPAAIAAAEKTLGAPLRAAAPQVIVTASLCGGAGSGMLPELGYLARSAMQELDCQQGSVTGLLLYGSGRNPTAKDLGMANAFACLSEIAHYGHSDSYYPGDQSLALEATEAPPYDQTYVMSLGDDLADDQFAAGAEQVASYLYLTAAAPASAYLDRCRQSASQHQEKSGDLELHTFGLAQLGGVQDDLLDSMTDLTCRRLLQHWRGEPGDLSSGDTSPTCSELTAVRRSSQAPAPEISLRQMETRAAQILDQVDLSMEHLLARTMEIVKEQLEGDPRSFFHQLSSDFEPADISQAAGESLLETLVQIVGPRKKECPLEDLSQSLLGRALQQAFLEPARNDARQLNDALLALADDNPQRLDGAGQAVSWVQKQIQRTNETSREITTLLERELDSLERFFFPLPPVDPASKRSRQAPAPPDPREQRSKYFDRRLHALTLQGVRAYLRIILRSLTETENALSDLSRDLKATAGRFDYVARQNLALDGQSASLHRLRRRSDELAAQLEQSFFGGQSRALTTFLSKERTLKDELVEELRVTGRMVVLAAIKELNAQNLPGMEDNAATNRLRHVMQSAMPLLADCGGEKRLIVSSPKTHGETLAHIIRNEFQEIAALENSRGDSFICYECQGLSLPHVARELIDARADIAELANRLRTRSDVDWNPWSAPVFSRV
ncbi:tubulin-like doman-containing protein [Lignipirellula cremea]|uniref:Tubulin-like protein n=1 Tax=Lignipirellula cremea TaxID=2528010 RepID=A0A518DMW2_9BACT|nr:tubulin-like doman-containing protein [Lignipirellula cremea]QDU93179.1 Tubulin-like protein [Lignipirellula cremea]